MKSDKPQDLSSASWRRRRDNYVVPVWKLASWRSKKSYISVQVWTQEQTSIPSSRQSSRRHFLLLSLFILFRPSTDWMKTIHIREFSSVQSLSWGPTLCDLMNCSTPDFPVHHQHPEFTQTHIHWIGDAIQPSHPLSSPSPPIFNLSQHQGLFQWVSSSHQVAKVLEFQLQHQSFQWTLRTDLL